MTPQFDPTADFARVSDALETVTLRRRGTGTTTAVGGALRQPIGSGGATAREAHARNRYNTWKEVAGDGRHVASDVVWHLPDEQLGAAPRLGDVIVDGDGRRWTILRIQQTTLRTRWRCVSRSLAIAFGLDDTVTILKATHAKSDAGAFEATWRPWKTGVRARIQPAAVDVETEHRARRTRRRFQIFLEEDVPLNHAHRIKAPDGIVYQVRGSNGTERIGELQAVDAEAVR
ncbi:MAG: hypothetical protein JXB62_20005 [Pirellulales bacterium]|nr:hypothetical protein [Pirellulales bacterium]